jgi:hypothetical protein
MTCRNETKERKRLRGVAENKQQNTIYYTMKIHLNKYYYLAKVNSKNKRIFITHYTMRGYINRLQKKCSPIGLS